MDTGSRRPVAVPDVIEKAKAVEENLIRIKGALAEANVGVARQLILLRLAEGRNGAAGRTGRGRQ